MMQDWFSSHMMVRVSLLSADFPISLVYIHCLVPGNGLLYTGAR